MIESHAGRLGVVAESSPDHGTPAATWAAGLGPLPSLDVAGWGRVLVVAPHPDDEVLGVGALLSSLVAAGSSVTVLAVTDGTAAYPALDPAALARTRTRESEAACADLGVEAPVRLGLPDGNVTGHERALATAVADHLRPGAVCLAPWRGDGHPDHEAAGRAAALACARADARLVEFPVWMWHWARPGEPDVPWDRAYAWDLGPDDLALKRRAVARFTSQLIPPAPGVEAILPPFVVDRLVTGREVVFA